MITFAEEVLLDRVSPEAREALARIGQRRAYRDGELIHSRGDTNSGMAIVIDGRVRLCRIDGNGQETLSSMVCKGQHYGDVLLFDGEPVPRINDAIAEGNVVLDHYDRIAFQHVIEIPDVLAALYRIAARRLALVMTLNEDLRCLSREAHLVKLLLMMWDQRRNDEPINVVQEDLASMLGISTMTLSKCLASLRGLGLIDTGYRQLRLVDVDGMRTWLADRC